MLCDAHHIKFAYLFELQNCQRSRSGALSPVERRKSQFLFGSLVFLSLTHLPLTHSAQSKAHHRELSTFAWESRANMLAAASYRFLGSQDIRDGRGPDNLVIPLDWKEKT